MQTLSNTLRTMRERISPSTNHQTRSAGNRQKSKPSDRVLAQAIHASAPDNSLNDSSHQSAASPDNQHLESSAATVEEINSHPPSSDRHPSNDSIDDDRPIQERFSEVRDCINHLKTIRNQPDYLSIAPPLHAEVVEEINKLSEHITLHQLSSTFRPDILTFSREAAQIRLTFSSSASPQPRRCSHSAGNEPIQQVHSDINILPAPLHCTSQIAEGLRRRFLVPESQDVFLPISASGQNGHSSFFAQTNLAKMDLLMLR